MFVAQPLCRLLQKDIEFTFDDSCKKAFDALREILIIALVIQPLNWSQPFEITCDASNQAVATVLGHKKEKCPHVIYYTSKTLDNAQCNYSTTKKELLAIIFCFKKISFIFTWH